jgi:hypothetical protein
MFYCKYLRRYDRTTGDLKCREVKTGFCRKNECKPVLPRLSLAGNLEKPLLSLYETEWRERGYTVDPANAFAICAKDKTGLERLGDFIFSPCFLSMQMCVMHRCDCYRDCF